MVKSSSCVFRWTTHSPAVHEKERGERTFEPTLKMAKWLFDQGFRLSIAGRAVETESAR